MSKGKQSLEKSVNVPEQKQDNANNPNANRIQIHQGNIPVLTVHFLSRIAESLEKIVSVMEK